MISQKHCRIQYIIRSKANSIVLLKCQIYILYLYYILLDQNEYAYRKIYLDKQKLLNAGDIYGLIYKTVLF